MKSIFGKILIWFLATLIGALIAFVGIAYLLAASSPEHSTFLSRMVAQQGEEAVLAFETRGREGLSRYLARLHSVFSGRHNLTDAAGKDVLSGQDLSKLPVKANGGHWRFPSFGRPDLEWRSADGRYRFLVTGGTVPDFPSVLPYYVCVLLAVGVLCYVMAVHLASPLRKLRQTVDQFGKGDLSVRAAVERQDEFGELSRSFNQMADRLQTLLTAERRLLQDISHELRSPLARLEFAVELARTSSDRGPAIDRIQRDIDRLGALVGELFQVTRAEGDPSSRKQDALSLDGLVRNLVEDCAVEADIRHCRVVLSAKQPLLVHGDSELLRRAVENILRNAIRHAPEGSSVEIGVDQTSGSAKVSIRDYGSGVPENALQEIFRPFYRVESDRNRNSGGAGLGLAIARRAIDLHHGRLYATNMHPGLMMTMELPVSAN